MYYLHYFILNARLAWHENSVSVSQAESHITGLTFPLFPAVNTLSTFI